MTLKLYALKILAASTKSACCKSHLNTVGMLFRGVCMDSLIQNKYVVFSLFVIVIGRLCKILPKLGKVMI